MTQSTVRLEKVCRTTATVKSYMPLRDIDLSVAQGEGVAVMTPSGSGKSSLLNLICGLDDPTSGTVSVAGITLSEEAEYGATGMLERVGLKTRITHRPDEMCGGERHQAESALSIPEGLR